MIERMFEIQPAANPLPERTVKCPVNIFGQHILLRKLKMQFLTAEVIPT